MTLTLKIVQGSFYTWIQPVLCVGGRLQTEKAWGQAGARCRTKALRSAALTATRSARAGLCQCHAYMALAYATDMVSVQLCEGSGSATPPGQAAGGPAHLRSPGAHVLQVAGAARPLAAAVPAAVPIPVLLARSTRAFRRFPPPTPAAAAAAAALRLVAAAVARRMRVRHAYARSRLQRV